MAIYTKRSGLWVASDGDAIAVENSATYHEAGTSGHTVGWDPGVEETQTPPYPGVWKAGWLANGFFGNHTDNTYGQEQPPLPLADYHPWVKDSGVELQLDCDGDTGPFGYRPDLRGVFQLGVQKPGVWRVTLSGDWESAALAPFFFRAETNTTVIPTNNGTFAPFAQTSGYAYPLTGGTPSTLTFTFDRLFTASGVGAYLGLRACVSATPLTTQRIKNVKVRLHWLSHAYTS